MFSQSDGLTKVVLSVLFFPMFFQRMFISFAWGQGDEFWVMTFKRIFVLLPTLAIILACWVSVVSLVTVVVRAKRQEYVTTVFVNWWDLGKAIFSFWGGIFRFVFVLLATVFGLLKLLVLGIWFLIHDIILIPFSVLRSIGHNVLNPGVPWIAVGLTLIWTVLEAAVFTYVTSPLVIDTLSNMTGDQLSETFIRVPLFGFMLFIVLASYAVLSTWTDAIRTRNVGTIAKITAIELVAMFMEIMFLYREFVDSLIPWFAQHTSGTFSIGIVGILLISGMAWLGVRGMTWFLFAAAGTPPIMGVIQGTGIRRPNAGNLPKIQNTFVFSLAFVDRIKSELHWGKEKGDDLLAAFVLPPLQVLGASVNFCTYLVMTQPLFELPFKSLNDVVDPRALLKGGKRRKKARNFDE